MTTTVTIRTDSALKKDFENFCKSVGMNTSSAITIFMTKVVNEKRIPFEISADPFYSSENLNVLKDSIQQLEAGKGSRRELVE